MGVDWLRERAETAGLPLIPGSCSGGRAHHPRRAEALTVANIVGKKPAAVLATVSLVAASLCPLLLPGKELAQ